MIRLDWHERVAVLVLDRPERRNALDVEHCRAALQAVEDAVAMGARCLVLAGEGPAFCAGADLTGSYQARSERSEALDSTDEDRGSAGDGESARVGGAFRAALYGLLNTVADLPFPTVASVQGPAIGAGTQLALAADLRVAGPTARFAVPTARLGLAVDAWTIRRLASLAGGSTARALLLGCDALDAASALRLGVVQRAGDHVAALDWAREIADLAPLSLSYSKLALQRLEPVSADHEVTRAFEACWSSRDFAEGQAAFREKRPPRFEGR